MGFVLSFLVGALGWYLGTTPEFYPTLWDVGISPDLLVTGSMTIGLVGMFVWLLRFLPRGSF